MASCTGDLDTVIDVAVTSFTQFETDDALQQIHTARHHTLRTLAELLLHTSQFFIPLCWDRDRSGVIRRGSRVFVRARVQVPMVRPLLAGVAL